MKKSIDPKKKEEALKRRAALKDLSSSLQTLSKQGLFPEFPTVNGLLRYYYQSKGYTDLKMERGGFLREERRKGHFALGATRSK